ncbi:MAG TPA: helix-turn-helix transcriptional regulator [Candidatus Baltobacteraceae bacterium]|jgi:transcriptional regulator with XRE-family HTH domain|nr:helix-turn-helix transcriptional regulator [Candidatus Baltobacteraceae bacterium]
MLVGFSDIGGAIRQARLTRGLSQTELGKQLGFTQGTVSRAERGSDLRLGTLMELARALDLELLLAPRRLVPTIRAITGAGSGLLPHSANSSEIYREADDDYVYSAPAVSATNELFS